MFFFIFLFPFLVVPSLHPFPFLRSLTLSFVRPPYTQSHQGNPDHIIPGLAASAAGGAPRGASHIFCIPGTHVGLLPGYSFYLLFSSPSAHNNRTIFRYPNLTFYSNSLKVTWNRRRTHKVERKLRPLLPYSPVPFTPPPHPLCLPISPFSALFLVFAFFDNNIPAIVNKLFVPLNPFREQGPFGGFSNNFVARKIANFPPGYVIISRAGRCGDLLAAFFLKRLGFSCKIMQGDQDLNWLCQRAVY